MNIIRNLFSKKISIKQESNFITININEECTINEYTNILKRTKYSYLLNIIDLKHLLKNNRISKRKIIIFKSNDTIYIISITNNTIYITRRTTNTNIIDENIYLDKTNYTYQISKSIHTIDGNTIDTKIYNKKKQYKELSLSKEEALNTSRTIVEELIHTKDITNYLNIKEIARILNIIPEKDFFPVIKNDILTLSWQNRYGSTNINEKQRATLDIILNATNELIGTISFNTSYNPNTSYTGSISYGIKEEFQNNHYATIALSLLKELLKSHKLQQNKPLYISTEENNIKSQHVALNNGGELCYEGEVPEKDNLTKYSGITKIKMYKITL